jgi:hypothetical protein
VGADRRGPLAAFVVVAIIAAILLVTSVRSQAAPWLDPENLPTSVVAGPVTEPHLWGSVSERLDQVVQDGVVLVHKAASDAADSEDRTTEALGASTSLTTSATTTPPASATGTPQPVGTPARHAGPRAHHPAAMPNFGHGHHAPQPSPEVQQPDSAGPSSLASTSDLGRQDHGRHLGWSHGHGHGAGAGEKSARGHGRGHGHAEDAASPGNYGASRDAGDSED